MPVFGQFFLIVKFTENLKRPYIAKGKNLKENRSLVSFIYLFAEFLLMY
jgi:hypothetical protein